VIVEKLLGVERTLLSAAVAVELVLASIKLTN